MTTYQEQVKEGVEVKLREAAIELNRTKGLLALAESYMIKGSNQSAINALQTAQLSIETGLVKLEVAEQTYELGR